ncbi:MAG: NlpC/P60 family protein [Thermodesulfobacteriota bacterium]
MPIRARTLVLLLSILILFSACGLPLRKEVKPHKEQPKAVDLKSKSLVKKKLYSQHREWKGVRYNIGGLNKLGVDCSGFVYLTYKSKLGIKLPRTTKAQIKVGKEVSKRKLRAGDLVFFKTSRKVRHVGIYIEDGKFLHASTSKGVMISRLDNKYWRKAYWKARRVGK